MQRANSSEKTLMPRKDWGQEEKGATEDEMVGWHHRLDGHEFGWTPGVGDGQGSLGCCDSWGRKESDTTERLNWTEHKPIINVSRNSVILSHVRYHYLIVRPFCLLLFNYPQIYTDDIVLPREIKVNPWTTQGLGVLILCTVKNPYITCSWPSVSTVCIYEFNQLQTV